MKFYSSFFVAMSALCYAGCSEPITHNGELAAKRALEFAEVALVRRNFDQGYALLTDKARSYVPLEKFQEAISRMHPDGYPRAIKISGYEPRKDEKSIYVSLLGENSGKQFRYTLLLNGTAASDYQVSTVDRIS